MAEPRSRNATQLFVSLAVLVVTLVLTYTTEYFSVFHGSWLVILAWFLLAAAAVTALIVKRSDASRLTTLRNVTFVVGVAVMAISIALAIWAHNMFSWLGS